MSVLEPNSRHLQEVLICCFHLKKTAAKAQRMLSSTYGEAALTREGYEVLINDFFNVMFHVNY